MKRILFLLTMVLCFGTVKSQNTVHEMHRYIEVTGSAELEIDPDEIRLIIGVREYWKEEFDKKSDVKDFRTKIAIQEVESTLMSVLLKIGIKRDNVITKEFGTSWRYRSKETLLSKEFEIVLLDFEKLNELIGILDMKGVEYMRVGELKNKSISEYRKKVKIEALKAAKEKSDYLLQSIGKNTGEVISIVELNNENLFYLNQAALSNSSLSSSQENGMDNVRKIKLRYEIKVRFEIN